MTRIFISYRRADSDIAGRIADRLINEFGREAIFLDVDSIPIGKDFRRTIDEAIERSSCLLVVIGPGWVEAFEHHDDGADQVQNGTDYVRLEINSALAQERLLVPVLVGSASMPKPSELPSDIRDIASINASTLRSNHGFRPDIRALLGAIRLLHGTAPHSERRRRTERRRASESAKTVVFESHQLVDSPSSLEGTTIGRYELTKFLAAGGGGAVYQALDKNLFREVCVKVAFPVGASAEPIKQLVAKGVRGIVRMKHAGIVPILDFDEFVFADGKNSFFIAMELVHGDNLAAWSARQSDDLSGLLERLSCAQQITAILRDAHNFRYIGADGLETVGVLHGDIKPNNIIINEEDTPRLLDFLMVDVQPLQSTGPSKRPQDNLCLTKGFGTPTYMAPEQEEHGVISTRTDVFSWGQTLADLFLRDRTSALLLQSCSTEQLADVVLEARRSVWGCEHLTQLAMPILELIAVCRSHRTSSRPANMDVVGQRLAEIAVVLRRHLVEANRSAPAAKPSLGEGIEWSGDAIPGTAPSPYQPSEARMYCTKCGRQHAEGLQFCLQCGKRNDHADTMARHEPCGGFTPLNGKYCRNCGTKMTRSAD